MSDETLKCEYTSPGYCRTHGLPLTATGECPGVSRGQIEAASEPLAFLARRGLEPRLFATPLVPSEAGGREEDDPVHPLPGGMECPFCRTYLGSSVTWCDGVEADAPHARWYRPDYVADLRARLASRSSGDGARFELTSRVDLPGGLESRIVEYATAIPHGRADDVMVHLTTPDKTYLGTLTLGWFRSHTSVGTAEEDALSESRAARAAEGSDHA